MSANHIVFTNFENKNKNVHLSLPFLLCILTKYRVGRRGRSQEEWGTEGKGKDG